MEAYDEARDRVGTLDADGQAAYASKCGAGIFACPCSRFDALYTLGMCSRCLIFPTERMMKATAHLDGYRERASRYALAAVGLGPTGDILRSGFYSK